MSAIDQAQAGGARFAQVCQIVGISARTIERWRDHENSFRGGKGDYVLSTTVDERPIRGLAKFYKTCLPQAIFKQSEAVISPVVSHDLRRSVASRIAESLGIGGEPLVQRLLGHSDSSVTAIYNRYAYLREIRAALEAWARITRGLISCTSHAQPPDVR